MTRADRDSLTLGCLLYLGSAPLLLFIFEISTMSGAAHENGTREWWVAVLGDMFQTSSGSISWILLAGFVSSLFLCFRGFWRTSGGLRVTIRWLMVAVMLVALGLAYAPLGFLMVVVAPVLLTLAALLRKPARARASSSQSSATSAGRP